MIEFDSQTKSSKPKEKRERPKRKKIIRRPISEARSAAAKAKIRDEKGRLLGKMQLQYKIDYDPEEQRYTLESLSGNGKIKEEEFYPGIIGVRNRIEKLLNRWRSGLV